MQIVIENIDTFLRFQTPPSKEFLKDLEEEMSYTIQEYDMFKKKNLELHYSLFDKNELKYPTGLFSILKRYLDKKQISYSIIDDRKKPIPNIPLRIHDKVLRDYQEEAVDKAIKSQRGIIKIATGGGKTFVAAAIVARLNLPTLVIVNSLDLLEQIHDEFTKILKIKIGKIGGGICEIERINICTVQTLFRVIDLKLEFADDELGIKEKVSTKVLKKKIDICKVLENIRCILVDETHHLRSSSYVDLMKFVPNCYFRYGLSGTPYNLLGTDLILDAYSGKQIIDISASYLIDLGFLVPPKIHILDPNLLPGYKYIHGRWDKIYDEWIVNNKKRNDLIIECVKRLLSKNKSILITVSRIEHGEIICDLLNRKIPDVKYAFMRGEVKKDERKKLLNEVRNKTLPIIIGTSVSDEGIDLPGLDSAILAGGGKSLIKCIQRVGRTLRPYPGKTEAIIIDFFDNVRYLTSQSTKRIKIYKAERRFTVFEDFKKITV